MRSKSSDLFFYFKKNSIPPPTDTTIMRDDVTGGFWKVDGIFHFMELSRLLSYLQCPPKRLITGEVPGGYWIQMQLQLELKP